MFLKIQYNSLVKKLPFKKDLRSLPQLRELITDITGLPHEAFQLWFGVSEDQATHIQSQYDLDKFVDSTSSSRFAILNVVSNIREKHDSGFINLTQLDCNFSPKVQEVSPQEPQEQEKYSIAAEENKESAPNFEQQPLSVENVDERNVSIRGAISFAERQVAAEERINSDLSVSEVSPARDTSFDLDQNNITGDSLTIRNTHGELSSLSDDANTSVRRIGKSSLRVEQMKINDQSIPDDFDIFSMKQKMELATRLNSLEAIVEKLVKRMEVQEQMQNTSLVNQPISPLCSQSPVLPVTQPSIAVSHAKPIYNARPIPEITTQHIGVRCATCGVYPIIGKRFVCLVCTDFNLCQNCEAMNAHSHPMIRCIGQAIDLPFAQLRKKLSKAEKKGQRDKKKEEAKAALNCFKATLEEENNKYKAQIVDLKISADKNQELKALEHKLMQVKVEEKTAVEIPKAEDLQEKKTIVGFMLNSQDAEAVDEFIRGLEHLSLENFVQAVAKKYNDSLVQLN